MLIIIIITNNATMQLTANDNLKIHVHDKNRRKSKSVTIVEHKN